MVKPARGRISERKQKQLHIALKTYIPLKILAFCVKMRNMPRFRLPEIQF